METLSDTLTFQRESIESAWDEALPTIYRNHAETGMFPVEEFNPSKARFLAIERAGALRVYTMRLDGVLIGYGVFAVDSHIFYPTRLCSSTFVFYVAQEHRGRRSIRFMLWTDRELEREGVTGLGRQVRGVCDYSRTLDRMGYRETERSYLRVI